MHTRGVTIHSLRQRIDCKLCQFNCIILLEEINMMNYSDFSNECTPKALNSKYLRFQTDNHALDQEIKVFSGKY